MATVPSHYEWNTLVRGEENLLAISGALRVLESPGERFNPLFVHGPPSVGKTHLLYALCQRLGEDRKDWNILALPAGEFLDGCDQAWRENSSIELRQQLWRLNALLIDDVHLLVRHQPALDELYHAFNRLVADGKQLVLTSRYPPAEMPELPAPLRNRFLSGLVVSLQPPGEPLRRGIVEQKCLAHGFRPTKQAIQFLSKELRDVRALEGTLHLLSQGRSGKGNRVTLEEVRAAVETRGDHPLSIAEVARVVCEHLGVELSLTRSACRQHSLVQARQAAMFLARELTPAPLTAIGAYFGGRDHSTVLYACRKIADDSRDQPEVAALLQALRARLRQ